MASQLKALHESCVGMAPVSLERGRTLEPLSTPDNWTQIVESGEKAMYMSEDGSREVMVIGYRFTPKGLMYELMPEKNEGAGKWMVSNRAIQPLNGFTRMIWVDLVTGEKRESPPIAADAARA